MSSSEHYHPLSLLRLLMQASKIYEGISRYVHTNDLQRSGSV